MANLEYYTDPYNDVYTDVVRDNAGNIISATRVDPRTGLRSTDIPTIFIGEARLTKLPDSEASTRFSQGGGTGTDAINRPGVSTPTAEYVYGPPVDNPAVDPPPVQLGLPPTSVQNLDPPPDTSTTVDQRVSQPLNAQYSNNNFEVNGNAAYSNVAGTPATANTRYIGDDATSNLDIEPAEVYNNTKVVTVGQDSVTIGMPGSTIKSNVDSNPYIGNIKVDPNVATPIIAPTRAVEFDPTRGSIEVGPASQVTYAADGNLYIIPDSATEVKLGTGVTQDVNGVYVVKNGGVAVLPKNMSITVEPGASITAMADTINNPEAITINAESVALTEAERLTAVDQAIPTTSAATLVGPEITQNSDIEDEYLATDSGIATTDTVIDRGDQYQATATNAINTNTNEAVSAVEESTDGLPGTGGSGFIPEISAPFEDDIETVVATTCEDCVIDSVPVAGEFLVDVETRANPFQRFATMTYSVSIYTMSAGRYSEMINSGKKSVQGMSLLVQSGGASNTSTNNFGASRSEHFDVDFYIDDIELKGLISGTSMQDASNTFELNFTIAEPNGLSFVERLYAAVTDYMMSEGAEEGNINYASQPYLMVIRFYGYDEYGNPVSGTEISKSEVTSDANAVSEKFIPFIITGIDFQVTNNMVEYRCKAACPSNFFSSVDTHATIPFNMELVGGTVKDVLAGKSISPGGITTSTQYSAARAASLARDGDVEVSQRLNPDAPLFFTGLAESMNKHQERISGPGLPQTYPHKYIIEFEDGSGIDNALIIPEGNTVKASSGISSSVDTPADKLNPAKNSVKKGHRIYAIPAGTSIIQAIEYVIRNSSYITSQAIVQIDQVTGEYHIKPEAAGQVLQWYKIRTQVTPGPYDNKTRDYAYEIRYVISRYKINDAKSPYFGTPVYRGVHKQYNYWFTGDNTEVLSFTQSYNNLYYQQMLGIASPKLQTPINNSIHVPKQYYMPRSNESARGGAGSKNGEVAASLASILYSPADQASAELEIVGDPDWIAQSEVFYSPKISLDNVGLGPYMPDGSVNYDASEVLFGLRYTSPDDYQDNGLMDINYNASSYRTKTPYGSASVNLVYRANELITNLTKGKFTQTIKGTLENFSDSEDIERVRSGAVAGTFSPSQKRQSALLAGYEISLADITRGLGGGDVSSLIGVTTSKVADIGSKLGNAIVDKAIDTASEYFDNEDSEPPQGP